jgi:hypothetical protein
MLLVTTTYHLLSKSFSISGFAFWALNGIHKTYVVGASDFLHVANHRIIYGLFTYLPSLNEFVGSTCDVGNGIGDATQLWGKERLSGLFDE